MANPAFGLILFFALLAVGLWFVFDGAPLRAPAQSSADEKKPEADVSPKGA
jgi:hypothetical protein